jgi:hypothetical protein
MTINAGEVYTFKINSGEELVTKVVSVDADSIQVIDPVSVAPGPQGMGLVPSLFTADHSKPITINTRSIIMYALTDEPVRVKYIEATTGLRVPEKKILMS